MTGIRVEPTTYTIRGLPDDDVNSQVWSITVEWRGDGRWAICHIGRCLSDGGCWDHEPLPSSRDKSWLLHHRFVLDEALTRAREAYPELVINGLRVENGKLVPE